MPYPVASIPLCSVTSVNCSRAPSSTDLQIVSVQPIRERQPGGRREQGLARSERLALNQIDIQVAVVVVVEHRDARPYSLGLIELAGHPVEVDEPEAGRLGPVGEPLEFAVRSRREGGGWHGRLVALGPTTHEQDNQGKGSS